MALHIDLSAPKVRGVSARISTRIDGQVGWLIFDHEARRNAVTLSMWQAIPDAVGELDRDPDVRVIVLRGAGTDAFVAGADISEFEQSRVGDSAIEYERANTAAYDAITSTSTPTIAMIHGFCVGGGLAIALCADIRYSDTDGRFTIPAAKLGVGYRGAAVAQLQQIVGPAVAKEILFSAKLFDAEHALRWGLVNEVVAPDDLEAHVLDMAGRIAANAPLTQHAVKLAANGAADDTVAAAVAACMDSDDYREGIRAFLEKRPPTFTGR